MALALKDLWLPGAPDGRDPKVSRNARGDVRVHAPLGESAQLIFFEEAVKRLSALGLRPIGGAAAGAWTFTNIGRTRLIDGGFDIDTDSWKMALHLSSGTQPGAATTTWAGLSTSEHAANNGYTAGGIAITLTLAGTTTVTVDIATDPVWTASGGSIVARWGVIYEVAGNVLCYCLLDSTPADVTATDGNTLTIAAHTSGVFTLA